MRSCPSIADEVQVDAAGPPRPEAPAHLAAPGDVLGVAPGVVPDRERVDDERGVALGQRRVARLRRDRAAPGDEQQLRVAAGMAAP